MSELMTGDQLKAWRLSLGFTQEQAAQEIGISEGWYKQLEHGHRRDDSRPAIISRTIVLACTGITARFLKLEQQLTPSRIASEIATALHQRAMSEADLAGLAGVSLQQLGDMLQERLDQVAVADVNRILDVLGLGRLEGAYHFHHPAVLQAGQ